MTEVTLASLAMDFDVRSADPATQKTNELRSASRALEEQSKATSQAVRDQAISQGLSGTAAGKAVQSVNGLVQVWGQARDALGRFTATDGSFRLSQDLTAKMLLQNANAATAYARHQEQAAKAVAKAEADAAREAQAAWKQSQAIQAEIMRERVALARAAEREEAQAARAVAKAEADAARSREADMNATATLLVRNAKLQADLARQQEQAATTTASYAAKVDNLRASLDPFAAVQLRLAQNTRLLDEALAHGAITARQYEDALSQVTRAATSDLLAIDNLNKAHGGLNGSSRTLNYTLLNLGRQASDLGVGFAAAATSGKPLQMITMTLIQQGPQIADAFATAKQQGLGFKTVMTEMAVAARGLIVTFGPWLAGLAAIGGAVWLAVHATEEHEKRIKALYKAIDDQNKKLSEATPWLISTADNAYLAAEGQKNFEEYLKRTNKTLEEHIKLMRAAAIEGYKADLKDAQTKQKQAQTEFDRISSANGRGSSPLGFTTNVGGFSTVSAAPSRAAIEQTDKYKEALKETGKAADNVRMAQEKLNAALKVAPDDYGVFAGGASQVEKLAGALDNLLPKEKQIADIRQQRAIVEQALAKGQIGAAQAARALAAADREIANINKNPAADRALKAAERQERAEAKKELAEITKAYEGPLKASEDFADALAKEVAVMGLSAQQQKRREIAMQAATAPTAALAEQILALGEQWEAQNKVAKEWSDIQAGVRAQQSETIRTINDALPPMEQLKRTLEDLAYAYERAFQSAGDFATAIARGDIGGALTGASRTLMDVSDLVGSGSKLGSMLGSAGAVLGPVGAAVGAVTSVLGVIGERSAAKAQAKLDKLNGEVAALRADNKTSSGSIAGALEQANKAWNSDLEYSSAMVASLRSIDDQIGALAVDLGRSIRTGGLLDTSGLGLGTTGSNVGSVFGAISGLLFGNSKTKTELLDQGLAFNPTSYGALANGGLTGSTYADLVTTKTKSLLGVTYGTKVSTSTVNGEIGGDLLGQISAVIQAIGQGVLSAAAVFGEEAAKSAEAALGSAVVDLGKLSLKGLKSDEIADVLQATLDKVGDQLAAAGVPGLDALAQVGEGAFETLTRLAREYEVVDVGLASIGKTFGAVGLASIEARDNLVQLLGGVDEFSSKTAFFASNFLTEAEQLAPVQAAVTKELTRLGLATDLSRDQFKSLVLGLDVSTESGAAMYAALLNLAPAFDKVTKASEEAATAAAKGYQDYLDQIQTATESWAEAQAATLDSLASSVNSALDSLNQLTDSLKEFGDTLGRPDFSGLNPTQTYAATKNALNEALASGSYDLVQSLGQSFIDASKALNGNSSAYIQDRAYAQAIAYSAAAANMGKTRDLGMAFAGLRGFATGGSFEVGGSGAPDSKLFNLALSPGEMVNVTRPGASNDNSYAEMVAELRALRAEVSALRASNDRIDRSTARLDRNFDRVTDGGEHMLTEAAS